MARRRIIPGSPNRPVTFQIGQKKLTMTGTQVLAAARKAAAEGLPPEAERYRSWVIDVDGQTVGVKWLFGLVTGLPNSAFQTSHAWRAFRKMGLTMRNLDSTPDQTPIRQSTKSIPRRNQFLQGFGDKLAELLPTSSEQLAAAFEPDRSWIKIKSRSFPGSHYELGLHRDCHEIAIHFESSLESSMRRLDVFIPLVEELGPRLGQQLRAERWGGNWARLYFELSVAELTESLEARYAQQMAQFIELTLPAMRQAYAGQHRRKRRPAGPELHVSERPHELLEQEITTIRTFLRGQSASRPSDEKLCDWVHLCYTFELYAEGLNLFQLTDPSQVNSWYYERSRKLAVICTMKAAGRA